VLNIEIRVRFYPEIWPPNLLPYISHLHLSSSAVVQLTDTAPCVNSVPVPMILKIIIL
jgi:hypothetical protein